MKKINSLEYNTMLWFLIRASFTEITFTALLYKLKQDAWISIIIGSLIGLIPLFIYEKLKAKFPSETILSLNNKIFKKGKIINYLILAGTLINAICTFWILIHFANSIFLYKTSLWIISIAFIIPIIYTASKGLHVIGKISLMLFYVSVFFSILIILGLTGNIDISNVKPILENNIKSIFNESLFFIGTNILSMFYLNIIPKNKITNYSVKKNLIFYTLICLNMLNITFTTICVFGIDLSRLYEYPAFQILKRVNILGILDRIESILSIESMFSLFIQMTITISCIKEIITTYHENKKTNKYIIPFICLIIFIISNIIFKTHESGEGFLRNEYIIVTYITCLILPLITLIKSIKIIKT